MYSAGAHFLRYLSPVSEVGGEGGAAAGIYKCI